MATIVNTNVDWKSFITFSANGIQIASFSEIRDAFLTRFKEIYGSDIDTSSATADGVYIQTLSLIVYNMLKSYQEMYKNMNVQEAVGKFLDNLCALSNVYRKDSTYSTASITLTLSATASSSYTFSTITVVDKSGITWTYSGDEITLEPGVETQITVTCNEKGPVEAEAGWIYQTITSTNQAITVNQTTDASVGSWAETDAELRNRRALSISSAGATIMENLVGALLALTGIEDVKIYNNNTGSTITAQDGTEIPSHQVYIVLRKQDNIQVEDSSIGSIIYEKMTPGILTTKSNETAGTSHSYVYVQTSLGIPIETGGTEQVVYWKEATPSKPEIKITITPNTHYATSDDSTAKTIVSSVIEYLNNLSLSTNVVYEDLYNVVKNADPKFRGLSTYTISSIEIDEEDSYQLKDTYFKYATSDYEITTSGENVVITIKGE